MKIYGPLGPLPRALTAHMSTSSGVGDLEITTHQLHVPEVGSVRPVLASTRKQLGVFNLRISELRIKSLHQNNRQTQTPQSTVGRGWALQHPPDLPLQARLKLEHHPRPVLACTQISAQIKLKFSSRANWAPAECRNTQISREILNFGAKLAAGPGRLSHACSFPPTPVAHSPDQRALWCP